MGDVNIKKITKKSELYKILVTIIDKKIDPSIKLKLKIKNFSHIIKEYSNLKNYVKTNIREYCSTLDKNKCNTNPHCFWSGSNCSYMMTVDMAKDYINKVLYEFIRNKIEF